MEGNDPKMVTAEQWMHARDNSTLTGDTTYLYDIERRENPTAILLRDDDGFYLMGVTVNDLDFMEGGATEDEMQRVYPRRPWSRAMMLSPRHGNKWRPRGDMRP